MSFEALEVTTWYFLLPPCLRSIKTVNITPVGCYEVCVGKWASKCKQVLRELDWSEISKYIGTSSGGDSRSVVFASRCPFPELRGKKTEALLSINHAVRLSKRCREAKPSNAVEQSWAMVHFSWPNSQFPGLQKWESSCGTLIAPDGMLIQGNFSFLSLFFCLLNANCGCYMKYHPDISDKQVIPCVRDTGRTLTNATTISLSLR